VEETVAMPLVADVRPIKGPPVFIGVAPEPLFKAVAPLTFKSIPADVGRNAIACARVLSPLAFVAILVFPSQDANARLLRAVPFSAICPSTGILEHALTMQIVVPQGASIHIPVSKVDHANHSVPVLPVCLNLDAIMEGLYAISLRLAALDLSFVVEVRAF
jgi:hypothetical protein